jgi:hypothetical protein
VFGALAAAGAVAASPAAAQSIGIDFVGGGNGGAVTPMASSESAGVVAQTNWNSLSGASGSASSLVASTGAATTVAVSWTSTNTWNTGIADTPGDNRLMKGYLDNSFGNPTTVSVTGLSLSVYDVIVYIDGDNGTEARSGDYTIGATTLGATDPANTNFAGSYVLGTNYLRFSGLTASSFTLTATPLAGPSQARAPINGVQIVSAGSAVVPEASTALLAAPALLGMAAMVARRRRLG